MAEIQYENQEQSGVYKSVNGFYKGERVGTAMQDGSQTDEYKYQATERVLHVGTMAQDLIDTMPTVKGSTPPFDPNDYVEKPATTYVWKLIDTNSYKASKVMTTKKQVSYDHTVPESLGYTSLSVEYFGTTSDGLSRYELSEYIRVSKTPTVPEPSYTLDANSLAGYKGIEVKMDTVGNCIDNSLTVSNPTLLQFTPPYSVRWLYIADELYEHLNLS